MKKAACFLWACLCLFPFVFARGEEFIWFVDESLTSAAPDPAYQARVLMRTMTDEQKIGQLLMVAPEDLSGERITKRLEDASFFEKLPVGGVILYGQNLHSEKQLLALVADIKDNSHAAGLYTPFVAMDEEGGYVSRLHGKLGEETADAAETIGQTMDAQNAFQAGSMIGKRLNHYGINLDFAPVADVLLAHAPELEGRSYGSDPQLVSDMAWQMAEGLRAEGIIPCYKHFPGHGTINNNAHNTPVSHTRTFQEMKGTELIPFRDAIDQGVEMIMLSHLIAKEIDPVFPASLSRNVVDLLLRQEMGFDGVVITDALRMDAIREKYDEGDAAVMAIQAGVDIVLVPGNGQEAFEAIQKAISKGELTMERIEESVERILALKIKSGLIQ